MSRCVFNWLQDQVLLKVRTFEDATMPWPRIRISKEEARKLWPAQKAYNEMISTENELKHEVIENEE